MSFYRESIVLTNNLLFNGTQIISMTENVEFIQKQIAYLLDQLEHQAHSGGKHQANVEKRYAQAGPYWPRETWLGFCNRVKKQLLEYGYPENDAQQKIDEATAKVKFTD